MALDFLILYEHIAREYESLLLLGEELRRRGYSYEIRQLLDRKKLKYFTWKKPKVVVSSNLYDNEGLNSHVYNNVGVCQKVVNLHWEQMLSDTQEAEPWFNFNGNAKKCVQTCWGEKTRQRLLDHGVPAHNAPVTGAVMMDFLRPEFRGYYKDKAELCAAHGLNAAKPLWLYISSFGYASMNDDEVRELSDMAGTDFFEFARVNRTSMAETLGWIERYLTRHPEIEFVYRRHPSEWNSDALNALSEKLPNFHVIFEGSVKQWITAADQLFIWMSSAIAEVYFARKNCHILRPQPIPHQFDPVIYKDASYIESYAAFEQAVSLPGGDGEMRAEGENPESREAVAGQALPQDFPIAPQVIEGYFDQSDIPSYRRMADLLEDIHQNPPRDLPFSEGFRPRFNWLKCFALLGVHILFALRLNPSRFSAFAGRIYGYVEKAHLPKKQRRAMVEQIRRFL